MDNRRLRIFDLKRIKGKGELKMRDCLGSGCNRKFMTTPETRLCPKCKRNLEKIDDGDCYSVSLSPKNRSKE